MKDIMNKYKERLIDISGRNRSLVMKKVYKKRAFDLQKLNLIKDDFQKEILEFIINRNTGNLLLIDDPYKIQKEKLKKLEENSHKLGDTKEVEKERIEKDTEKIIDYIVSLRYLIREIAAVEKECGKYELYAAYPFVEGRFKDRTFVRAPLLLCPIRIYEKNNKFYMENINEQPIFINKVFLNGCSKYNEMKISDFDTEFETLESFGEDKIKGILSYLAKNDINIEGAKNKEIHKFEDYTASNMPEYGVGELKIKTHLILGQFPISNSIYNDYLELEKTADSNKLLQKLLVNKEGIEGDYEHTMEEHGVLSLSEEKFFYLTSLDYSQEKAVKKVSESDQLVIYGPPGTGKSQTIANIISDALAKDKRVLMVSQKKAALDVIYNRLSSIQDKLILLHDINKDKKGFYEKVASNLENMNENSIDRCSNDINQRAKHIDNIIESLEKLALILHKKRDFGLSLQQMYSKSKVIKDVKSSGYSMLRSFSIDDKMKKCTYSELNEAVKMLNSSDTIEKYGDYRKLVKENSLFDSMNSSVDFLELQNMIDNLDKVFETTHIDGVNEIKNSELGRILIESYKSNKFNVDKNKIKEIAEKYNNDKNKELLEPINKNKWWSITYWLKYKKNKLQEEKNREEFNKKRDIIKQEIEKYHKELEIVIELLDSMKKVFSYEIFKQKTEDILEGKPYEEMVNPIMNCVQFHEKYTNLKYRLSKLKEVESNVLEYLYREFVSAEEVKKNVNNLLETAILFNLKEIEKNEDEKNMLMEYLAYESNSKEVNRLMEEKNSLTPELIKRKWNYIAIQNSNCKDFKEFKRQANKKRALWPIRKYVSEFSDLIFNSFPCWLLSPDSVSDVLPLANGLFDLIIFDEASQMYVENAIPTIYRGKSVVIAGDDKQLKPTATFKSKLDDVEEDEKTIENAAALEEESLLDLAKVNYDYEHLNYHYRSKYGELINFSNYAFYGGRLQISPNVEKSSVENPPIERIKVQGKWIGRKNLQEAIEVVQLISRILKGRENEETIGVITFNVTQKDLIEDLLERKASKDPIFKSLYSAEIERRKGDEDVSLFVKNIENVQGDERDIIIFSIGYAQNENGRVSVNFGSLSQDGGENRLNVAVSRAKEKIYVVTSIEPEELKVDGTKNIGPKIFKKYLQYAKAVSDGNKEDTQVILNSILDSNVENEMLQDFDSDFEVEVYERLKKLGYEVHNQIGVSGYKIDLAIYDPKTSRYVIGIECDGAAFHSSKSARERDIHRQRYLESRGWRIARIWSRDWWMNPDKEIEKIKVLL